MTSSARVSPIDPESDISGTIPRGLNMLGAEDLQVVYQPIVDLSGRRVFAYEALARCKWPNLADPEVLFARAAASQACGHVGRLIRHAAVQGCSGVPLFLNIHPEELTADWLLRAEDPIAHHDHDVYLEVTETAAFTHHDECLRILKELASRNRVYLAVDDLGSGYSNLRRVLDLEPRIVKLDRTLVSGLHENRRQQLLVRYLVQLCSDLGAKVVVEGVETREEFLAVLDTGAQLVQGYFFARPSFPPPPARWPGVKRLSWSRGA